MSWAPLAIDDRIVIPPWDLVVETMRASGPGGQGVNTTDSAVRLRFQLDACTAIAPGVKRRIREARPNDVTREGELLIHVETGRSQHDNLAEARERLVAIVRACLRPPKPRIATRPSKASQRRRVEGKKQRSEVKKGRGKVSDG